MCHDFYADPAITPISGAAVDSEDLVLVAGHGVGGPEIDSELPHSELPDASGSKLRIAFFAASPIFEMRAL